MDPMNGHDVARIIAGLCECSWSGESRGSDPVFYGIVKEWDNEGVIGIECVFECGRCAMDRIWPKERKSVLSLC